MKNSITKDIKFFTSTAMIGILCLNVLNACVPPSDRKPIPKVARDIKLKKEKEKLKESCKAEDRKNSKECLALIEEQKEIEKKCSDAKNESLKECKELKLEENKQLFKTKPGFTKPTVESNMKVTEVTSNELENISDLLDYAHNKFEVAWQVAVSAEKAIKENSNKKSSSSSNSQNDGNNNKETKVNSSVKLGTTVFSFTRKLIDEDKIAIKKESTNIRSADNRYAIIKNEGKLQSEFIIFGSIDNSVLSFQDIVNKGRKLISILYDSKTDVYHIYFNPSESQNFVKTGLNVAQIAVEYKDENPPQCGIMWNKTHREKSELLCSNLTYDIDSSSAFKFEIIKFTPTESVLSDNNRIIFTTKYLKISSQLSDTSTPISFGPSRIANASTDQVEITDAGVLKANEIDTISTNTHDVKLNDEELKELQKIEDQNNSVLTPSADTIQTASDSQSTTADSLPAQDHLDEPSTENSDTVTPQTNTNEEESQSPEMDRANIDPDLITPTFESSTER